MDPNTVDIESMSEDLDIPLGEIKAALGLPLPPCLAQTTSEAEDILDRQEGTEEWMAALLKLKELCRKAIEKATTPEEAREAFELCPEEDLEGRVAAFLRWKELSMALVAAANTKEDILDAYNSSPSYSAVEAMAIRKLAEFYRK